MLCPNHSGERVPKPAAVASSGGSRGRQPASEVPSLSGAGAPGTLQCWHRWAPSGRWRAAGPWPAGARWPPPRGCWCTRTRRSRRWRGCISGVQQVEAPCGGEAAGGGRWRRRRRRPAAQVQPSPTPRSAPAPTLMTCLVPVSGLPGPPQTAAAQPPGAQASVTDQRACSPDCGSRRPPACP